MIFFKCCFKLWGMVTDFLNQWKPLWVNTWEQAEFEDIDSGFFIRINCLIYDSVTSLFVPLILTLNVLQVRKEMKQTALFSARVNVQINWLSQEPLILQTQTWRLNKISRSLKRGGGWKKLRPEPTETRFR